MWSFVKNNVRNGSNPTADGHAIQDNGTTHSTPQEKAELFRNKLGSIHPKNIQVNRHYENVINNAIQSQHPNKLNGPITQEEVDVAIPKSKSNAVGEDLILTKCLKTYPPRTKKTYATSSTDCWQVPTSQSCGKKQ
ncbi:hypothetical protein DAPPUDRAFT_321559 [Daphnia pulex]|uniref:Uncharacterized protein n=1 Tax=Daphnia pulex TaxID=6669 RepID=E9GT07_DAPPU|nr:hypothetical protein DAPPUDRAFT_321559 [Daphnia pulex]|eukprot:EFX77286.1 hypothetical protein DAPPUDRAFT_321559 [Daphnia pulex]